MSISLRERITEVCCQNILPHLEKYRVEPDLEKRLPFMEPGIFSGFAAQACRDVAALASKALAKQFRRYTSGMSRLSPALTELAPTKNDEAEARKRLNRYLADFTAALQGYAPIYQRFCQRLGTAHQSAWDRGSAIGAQAGTLFGGLTGVLVACVGGFLSGRSLEQELQAEGENLQQAFGNVIQAYDQMASSITEDVLYVLRYHRKQLEVLVLNG